ncbi:magnesium transporter, partial [bacterium]
ADVYPADVADILEELDREQRTMIFQQLDPARASDILEEIDPNVQRDLIFSLSNQKAAELVDRMTPGQAADVLSALSYGAASRILALLEKTKAEKIRSIMQKQEATIFNFATQNYLKLPPNLTAAEVRDSYPKIAKDKDVVTYIYVTDEQNRLLGVIDLKQLLKAEDQVAMRDIMVENIITLNPTNTIREAYNKFARYNFRALPITDKNDKILGIVPYRDIMNLKHRILE